MFAQYNQHYQQAGGTAVSTGGLVWNGAAWVNNGAGPVAVAGTHSTYSTGYSTTANYGSAVVAASVPVNNQVAVVGAESPAALVTKYTEYYHQWTARAQEHEQYAQQLPLNSNERVQAQQHADWSKYYADQSSRAAHHYHSNPHVTPPFELPPAPPAAPPAAGQQQQQQQQQQQTHAPQPQRPAVAVASPNTIRKASRWSAEPPQSQATTAGPASSSSSDGPPDSLKRYVHRCLQQCKTPEQTKTVEQETEKLIAKALQNGTLHSTNWDAAPLIPLPGGNRINGMTPIVSGKRNHHQQQQHHSSFPLQQQQHLSKKQKLTSNDSYYGPAGGSDSFSQNGSVSNNYQDQQQTANGGYYGPASSRPQPHSSNTTNPESPSSQNFPPYQPHHQKQQQQQKQHKNSKYNIDDIENQDFIAMPVGNGKKKNAMKYVNPNSTKHNKKKKETDDGFQRSSTTLAKRANRFSGPGGVGENLQDSSAYAAEDRYMGKAVIGGSMRKLDETDYEHMKVKGTCQTPEKQYLRLTAPPRPELVRPLEILKLHLTNLKAEWARGEAKRRDYLWFCSEMKAVRQDLTVQHISNAFTVDVYETHARMALQENDLNEFNQAQTQLKVLYSKLLEDPKAKENENEFVAYRMIYFVMLTLNKKYSGGSSDLLNLMLSLTPAQREDPAVQNALQVRAAVADVDYYKFFDLHKSCPNLGHKLTGLMVPTIRHWALQRICRAYRPLAEVDFVLEQLGFPVATKKELEDGKKFLLSCGCVLNDERTEINTKDSLVRESDLQEKRSLI